MELNADAIAGKLAEGGHIPYTSALLRAQKLLSCPEIGLNIRQWLQGQPLTDITIRGWSAPMILNIWGSGDIPAALELLADLALGDDPLAEMRIWGRTRR